MSGYIITCGDADGIGAEVTGKALFTLLPKLKNHVVVVFVSKDAELNYFPEHKIIESIPPSSVLPPGLYLCLRHDNPIFWVNEAVDLCLGNHFQALITGPLSKGLSQNSSLKVLGHTDLFRKRFSKHDLFMAFLGESFNVVLLSDHIPLNQVTTKDHLQRLPQCIQSTLNLKQKLGLTKPVAVVGLNPHAGEGGLIGNEEDYIKDCLKKYSSSEVCGPLVPDAAFLKDHWKNFSFFICMYHDQGLIPFKMQHGQDAGIQVSVGLPFLRTSVDHGTAKNIFGTNTANPQSMIEAISYCLHSRDRK